MKVVLASSNPHKVKEINEIKGNCDIDFILPPDGFDPDERGKSFEENSLIKAQEAWKLSHTWSLADDSGLCIDALGGKPGIYSARYAETPQKRIERVLKELEGVNERTARFVCHMTLINPQGEVALSCEGICEGKIINEARGTNGFGYDPIFLPNGYNQTIAELPEDEKNRISHRSKALQQVIEYFITL